jgi:hypothetical protein
MIDDIRTIARIIHLLLSLLAALVAFVLTWYILRGMMTKRRWPSYSLERSDALLSGLASFFVAASSALCMHAFLDWCVGVP